MIKMKAIDIGRVCVILKGRHAGEKCVIIKLNKENNVFVFTSKGKEKKVNIRHLFPLKKIVTVMENKKDLMKELEQVKIE